jgi:hypothetical protein
MVAKGLAAVPSFESLPAGETWISEATSEDASRQQRAIGLHTGSVGLTDA